MKKDPIIKEVIVNAPISKVWGAISNKDTMKTWYFEVPEFKTEIGFEFKFFGEKDGRKYPISCRIIDVEVNKKLTYTWNYDDFPTETIVSFELTKIENRTKLRLTHSGLHKIPAKYKDVSKESHELGWEAIIMDSFKYYVEKE